MGKKRKIISKPQKFGKKHANHPLAKPVSKTEEVKEVIVEAKPEPIVVEAKPEPKKVQTPKEEPRKRSRKASTTKKTKPAAD